MKSLKDMFEYSKRYNEIVRKTELYSYVRIVNAAGTSNDKPNNGDSWREFWEKKTGHKLIDLLSCKDGKFQCPCYESHEDGDDEYVKEEDICGCHVHIWKDNGMIKSKKMYIVPMCRRCNNRDKIFKIPSKLLIPLED